MIFGEYSWNIFEKSFQNNLLKYILKNFTICLMFVLKKIQKYIIFKVFQFHLQVFLLFKNSGYKFFYIIFEGPNVNKIISYFEHVYNKILYLIMCKKINLFSS